MDVTYAYTGLNSSQVRGLVEKRQQLDDLVTQETTKLKSQSYAGIEHRSLTLAFQGKIVQNAAYQSTVTTIDPRLNVIGDVVDSLSTLANDTAGELGQNGFLLTSDGTTPEQSMAQNALEGYVSALDTEYNGIYLFGGKATDTPPVASTNTILKGEGTKAGFETVMAQRLQADLGANGLGRLTLSSTGTTVSLAEDGVHPFGAKLTAIASTLSNVTASGPTGSPAAMSVALSGQPTAGQKIDLTLTLPDGSTSVVTLTAGATADADKDVFAIGATATDTATNIASALQTALTRVGKTDLTAASAEAAADNFFDTTGGGTPMRVAGPPYATATSLVAGTTADTVFWYTGTNDAANPRDDATARVDDDLTISYGTRANETAFVDHIKQLAVMASVDVSAGGTTEKALYSAVVERVKPALQRTTGSNSLQAVATSIVGAQKAAEMATTRLKMASETYQTAIDQNTTVDDTTVAVQLAALQTQMSASYKATSMLYKMTLADYM